MNIRGIVDKMKTPFEKGQKLEKLYPAFNAFETFLFVPNHTSKTGAHIRDAIDLKRVMITRNIRHQKSLAWPARTLI